MSLPLLERLVRLMAENGLTNVELKDGDQRIILSRGGGGGGETGGTMMPAMMPAYPPMGAMPMGGGTGGAAQMPQSMPSSPAGTEGAPSTTMGSRPSDAGGAAGGGSASTAGLAEIKSPMVGTFYASPSPDAKPFVRVGDRVGPDTDVCIIEAMKVFNNIKAETSGTIEKVLAEGGQAVEYGQVLFLVRPS